MDNRIVVFLLIAVAFGLAIVVGVAVASSELMLPAALAGGFAAVVLIASPRVGAFLAVALFASRLTLPGLPGSIGFSQILLASIPALTVMLLVFGRTDFPRLTKENLLLIAFTVIVLMTGFIRGFGFRFLGSNLWGGTIYLDIVLGALLVLTLPKINMPAEWWPVAIIIFALTSTIPLLGEIFIAKTGAVFLYLFIQIGQTNVESMISESDGVGVGRLLSAGSAAAFLMIGFLSVVHTSRLFNLRSSLAIVTALGIVMLSLLSGFRLSTAVIVLTVFATALYQKTLTLPRVIFGAAMSCILLATLYFTADNLPSSAQRAISWLPGIGVSTLALGDADQTVDWRLDVWREAAKFIPDYFWIGKGLAFDGNLLMKAMSGGAEWDPISWALIEGSYHNGYLSLLLGFGIFGLLVGLAMLIFALWRLARLNFAPWKDPRLHRCYQAFLGYMTFTVIVFLSVYGDVSATIPGFFFTWACLESIRVCDERSEGIARSDDSAQSRVEQEHAYIE